MAKTEVFLQGKTKWFRANQPNEWGKWAHVLYPNDESLKTIRDLQTSSEGVSGIKNVLKKDEDGYSISLGRSQSKVIRGKVVGFAPPEVLEADGKTPLRDVLVGNGSDVTSKIEVYTHPTPGGGRARAIRWVSTRIDNLIPYTTDSFNEKEQKAIAGLTEQPAQF